MHPCGVNDFTVTQFTGSYGFVLPAAGDTSLSRLGLPPSSWPQVSMLNRPVNQDGCKDATLNLGFTGTALGGNP
jgi:hypothetical protein